MDIKQLRYFLAIAREGQITRAAKSLHMAQPPLSQQLILLEEELGVKLVERTGRMLKLTDAGLTLQLKAEKIMDLLESTVTEIKGHKEGARGTLSIGTVASVGAAILSDKITMFHSKYPEVYFRVWEGDTNKIKELLEARTIDIGLVRFPINSDIYNILPLSPEPLMAAMSSKWSREGNGPLRLRELKDLPLLLLRIPQRKFIYEQIREAFAEMGSEPRVLCESLDMLTLLLLAESGMGVTIIPKSALKLIRGGTLCIREIIEPELKSTAAVIWLRNRAISTAVRRFIDLFSYSESI